MAYMRQHKFSVVLLSQPGVRHSCQVQSVTDKELVCQGKFGTVQRYDSSRIAALIEPGRRGYRWAYILGFQAAGVGTIVTACVLAIAPAVAVPLIILGAALFFTSGAYAMADDDGSTSDSLFYLRSGAQLTVNLKRS